jgi:hypothetical protein
LGAALVVDLELGEAGLDEARLEFERSEDAAVFLESGLLAVAFFFVQCDDADAEEALGDGLVEIEDFAVRVEAPDGRLEFERVFLKVGG